jgi:hypothetical protein
VIGRGYGNSAKSSMDHSRETGVGATYRKSSASQSQARNLQLLSNGSVNKYPRRWNSWIYNLLLGKTYKNTCFPSGPIQGNIKGDQTRSDHWDLRKTAAAVVRSYTLCITYNKDLHEELNRGYLFTRWHNLRRWKRDTHTIIHSNGQKICLCSCSLKYSLPYA